MVGKPRLFAASPKWWSDILLSGWATTTKKHVASPSICLVAYRFFFSVNLLQLINYRNFGVNYLEFGTVWYENAFFYFAHNKLYEITVIRERFMLCLFVHTYERTNRNGIRQIWMCTMLSLSSCKSVLVDTCTRTPIQWMAFTHPRTRTRTNLNSQKLCYFHYLCWSDKGFSFSTVFSAFKHFHLQ